MSKILTDVCLLFFFSQAGLYITAVHHLLRMTLIPMSSILVVLSRSVIISRYANEDIDSAKYCVNEGQG